MSLLEKIKSKKDAYTYILKKAENKKADLTKTYDKSETSRTSWSFWNGVVMNCKQVLADLSEIERDCEMAFQSVEVDLSALRGE